LVLTKLAVMVMKVMVRKLEQSQLFC